MDLSLPRPGFFFFQSRHSSTAGLFAALFKVFKKFSQRMIDYIPVIRNEYIIIRGWRGLLGRLRLNRTYPAIFPQSSSSWVFPCPLDLVSFLSFFADSFQLKVSWLEARRLRKIQIGSSIPCARLHPLVANR